ncbi:MAG TPA: hypothetical protein VN828_03695 [Acidobacteriaceae bacterium]|nr:hypothetical protein [Acidobacteriaceae bacterium]
MHRDIMGAVKGDEIDHRVGVGLDNQKHNLRKATRSQQRANQGPRKDNRQGFKGVKANRDKWAARITHKGHRYHLGVFLTVEDAAKAYAAKAREFYGEFARVA